MSLLTQVRVTKQMRIYKVFTKRIQNLPDIALLMAFVQYLFASMQHVLQPLLIDQTTSFVVAKSPRQHDSEQKLWGCTARVRAISVSHRLCAGVSHLQRKDPQVCNSDSRLPGPPVLWGWGNLLYARKRRLGINFNTFLPRVPFHIVLWNGAQRNLML
jgi:hypothetical protein